MKKEKIITKADALLSDFNEDFVKELKANPKKLSNFIKFIIKEYEKDGDFRTFLEGVKVVLKAKKGMTKVSRETKINRDTLYKAFSKNGNPAARTYFEALKSIGIRVQYNLQSEI